MYGPDAACSQEDRTIFSCEWANEYSGSMEGVKFMIGCQTDRFCVTFSFICRIPVASWDVQTISGTESCGISSGTGHQSALQYEPFVHKNPSLKTYIFCEIFIYCLSKWIIRIITSENCEGIVCPEAMIHTWRMKVSTVCVLRARYIDACTDCEGFRCFFAFGISVFCDCV